MAKKIFLAIILLLVIGVTAMILFSPYKNYKETGIKSVQVDIDISRSPSAVFEFLGNSDNASDWSVFVDHITCLNSTEILDGQVGSIRRCFKEKNERQSFWDEKIIEVIPNKKRRLSVYNLNGFSISTDKLFTEQLYEEIENGYTRLRFTLVFPSNNPGWINELKMHFASYFVRDIFIQNLKNIKELVEQ